tara:strand:- start:1990 stop:2235 length:246 start_codon:yes stop_codon:yes gene_type:complete
MSSKQVNILTNIIITYKMNKINKNDNFVSELICDTEEEKDFYMNALHYLKFITRVFKMQKVNNTYYYLIMVYEDKNHQVII